MNASIALSYQQWTEADQAGRVNMVAQALIRIIDQIKDSKLNQKTKANLRRVVEGVRSALTADTLH